VLGLEPTRSTKRTILTKRGEGKELHISKCCKVLPLNRGGGESVIPKIRDGGDLGANRGELLDVQERFQTRRTEVLSGGQLVDTSRGGC